jgi:Ca2+/Na+ antiporter
LEDCCVREEVWFFCGAISQMRRYPFRFHLYRSCALYLVVIQIVIKSNFQKSQFSISVLSSVLLLVCFIIYFRVCTSYATFGNTEQISSGYRAPFLDARQDL